MDNNYYEGIISYLSDQFELESPVYEELIAALGSNEPKVYRWIISQIEQEMAVQDGIYWKEIRSFHQRFLKEDMDFVQGMDMYRDMEMLGILICDVKYIVFSNRLSNIIQFLYTYLQKRYIEFINEERNPFCLFPLIEELKSDQTKNAYSIMANLISPLKGICAGFVWNEIKEETRDDDLNVDQMNQLSQSLSLDEQWIFIARVLEELTRQSFSSTILKPDTILKLFIKWIVDKFGGEEWSREQICNIFLYHLTGRVNRESWLGALYLASELDKQDKRQAKLNARLLREEVVRVYPNLWGEMADYFFSGRQSIALLRELSQAFYLLYDSNAIQEVLKKNDFKPGKLWKLRDIHCYSEYHSERQLGIAHFLLLVFVVQIIQEKEQRLPVEWRGIEENILLLCKQIFPSHLIESEELILQELLKVYGKVCYYAGCDTNILQRLIRILPPTVSVYLLKDLGKTEHGREIRSLLNKQIEKYIGALRSQEQLNLAHSLYVLHEFELCVKVFERIPSPKDTLKGYEEYYQLYVSALFLSLNENNRELHIEYLHRALHLLNRFAQKYPYMRDEKYYILRGYVMGALYDRQQIDIVKLQNEYQEICHEQTDSLDLTFVKVELLMRILDTKESLDRACIEKFEEMLAKIKDIEGIRGNLLLMNAWLANKKQQSDPGASKKFLEQAKPYLEEFIQVRALLPFVLHPYLELIIGEEDEGYV